MLDQLLQLGMDAAIISGGTEQLKQWGVPPKYLTLLPAVIGGVSGFIQALPQSDVDNIEAMLTTGGLGLLISLIYKALVAYKRK